MKKFLIKEYSNTPAGIYTPAVNGELTVRYPRGGTESVSLNVEETEKALAFLQEKKNEKIIVLEKTIKCLQKMEGIEMSRDTYEAQTTCKREAIGIYYPTFFGEGRMGDVESDDSCDYCIAKLSKQMMDLQKKEINLRDYTNHVKHVDLGKGKNQCCTSNGFCYLLK